MIKVGVFFGGQSREREISFAGGRTVYDNLNKSLFEPIPIFVDSLGNFIQLNWEYIYKGTIRDFYPPVSFVPFSESGFQIYVESLENQSELISEEMIATVGKKILPTDFNHLFDVAFLALHGGYGEDGNLQGILEWQNLPYTGAGILSSSIGIDKSIQSDLMKAYNFPRPQQEIITKEKIANIDFIKEKWDFYKKKLHLPFVVKSAKQGSSIGVSIVEEDNFDKFYKALQSSCFIVDLTAEVWNDFSKEEKRNYIVNLVDIRSGIGLPLELDREIIYHPENLLSILNEKLTTLPVVRLSALDSESTIVIESFIEGKEFSCIVLEDDQGETIALPPTEIIKGKDLFDYRSKYLPGMTRKVTPIDLPTEIIYNIQKECKRLFKALKFDVYARIDGFLGTDGNIYLNDPNTTSGMLPSSFFFHQAAEIGLNPSQFLTFILRASLKARLKNGKKPHLTKALLEKLDTSIEALQKDKTEKTKVAVIMGGYSSERHISVESGRNIYEKLASSPNYEPIPIFLTGSEKDIQMYQIPINIMLKDNADDIKEKVLHSLEYPAHEVIQDLLVKTKNIAEKYTQQRLEKPISLTYQALAEKVDIAFIALHGRPGEDGALQVELEKVGIPYNGSGQASSSITINKFETNEILHKNGVLVAGHALLPKTKWNENPEQLVKEIEEQFVYPLIAKPADDGCSSAVKKIKTTEELTAFLALIFREKEVLDEVNSKVLSLKRNEEFPMKENVLIEELITAKDADHFLEITGGMLTHHEGKEKCRYEIFEPSEALASGEVLSLEEKFLAGEGQNITPARFGKTEEEQARVSKAVRKELEKVANILNIEGYARIDAFVRVYSDRVETLIIEINSLPGMTPATCIFHQAAINDYKPYEFINGILEYGKGKKTLA